MAVQNIRLGSIWDNDGVLLTAKFKVLNRFSLTTDDVLEIRNPDSKVLSPIRTSELKVSTITGDDSILIKPRINSVAGFKVTNSAQTKSFLVMDFVNECLGMFGEPTTTSAIKGLDIWAKNVVIGNDQTYSTGIRSANTNKQLVISCPDYLNTGVVASFYQANQSTANDVSIGGGISTSYSANNVTFYTSAGMYDTTGSNRLRINKNGYFGIGTINPTVKFHVLETKYSATATDGYAATITLAPTYAPGGLSVCGVYAGVASFNATPTAGGTGYTVGDTLTVTTGGTGAQCLVLAVNAGTGAVTQLQTYPVATGTGYTTGTGKATTGGTGTGCTVRIMTLANGAKGSGYTVGDVLTLVPSGAYTGSSGTVTVASVDGDGGVLTVTVSSAGDGWQTLKSFTTTGGTGSGCEVYPVVNAASTITRHNYLNITNVGTTANVTPTITDACFARFDAAAGTHKAVDSGSNNISGWLKWNLNGTKTYQPVFEDKDMFAYAGTAKANFDILSLTNKVNAADMDGTETSILFNQWYYDASTPAVADAARITVGTETDWTSTASTQDSYIKLQVAVDGTITERARLQSKGSLYGNNWFISEHGGYATKFTAGQDLSQGDLVAHSNSVDKTAVKCDTADGTMGTDMTIGVVYASAASGSEVWVVHAGNAFVHFTSSVSAGMFAYGSNVASGIADADASPSTTYHWREIGHTVSAIAASGLALTIMHWN